MKTVAFVRTTNIYDDSRATKEISALAEAGYRVVVLGWDRNGCAEEKTRVAFKMLNVEFRFFHCLLPTGIGIRNMDKLLKWIIWTKKELNTLESLYAVHACNLDGGYGPYLFCKKNNVPLVYDIYDYYVDSHAIPSLLNGFVESLETRIIDYAYATIICTEERREQIKKANPKRVIVIHNSPDVPDTSETSEIKYEYAYCGSLCDMRLVKEILDEYKNHSELRFAFAGNDKYINDVEKMASRFENFKFFGTVPYSEVLELEKQSAVLSAIYEPSIRNHRLCAPNKFYEALALGKPVIVCRGTGIDRVIADNEIGIVINYDAKEFYDALLTLLSDNDLRIRMGKRARNLYNSQYKWSIMKDALLDEYSSMQSRVFP